MRTALLTNIIIIPLAKIRGCRTRAALLSCGVIFAWKNKPLRSSCKIRALLRCHEKLEHAPTAARVTIVETPGLAGRSLSDPNTKARGIHGCEGRRKGKGEGYVLMLAHSGSCTRIVQAIRLLAATVVPVYTNEVLLHQTPYQVLRTN